MKLDYLKLSLQILCGLLLLGLVKFETVETYSFTSLSVVPTMSTMQVEKPVDVEEDCEEVSILAPDTLAALTPMHYDIEPLEHIQEVSSTDVVTVRLTDIVKSVGAKYSKKQVEDFLASGQTLKRAFEASEETGVPPSVLLAQVILESDLGNSQLTQATGNRGNIKCRCNRRPSLRKQHAAQNASGNVVCVQGYDKIERSNDWYEVIPTDWQDWSKRVTLLKRYGVVRRAKGTGKTWLEYCDILHRSPYATDARYNKKLANIIRAYNLNELDEFVEVNITSASGTYVFWDGYDRTNS